MDIIVKQNHMSGQEYITPDIIQTGISSFKLMSASETTGTVPGSDEEDG